MFNEPQPLALCQMTQEFYIFSFSFTLTRMYILFYPRETNEQMLNTHILLMKFYTTHRSIEKWIHGVHRRHHIIIIEKLLDICAMLPYFIRFNHKASSSNRNLFTLCFEAALIFNYGNLILKSLTNSQWRVSNIRKRDVEYRQRRTTKKVKKYHQKIFVCLKTSFFYSLYIYFFLTLLSCVEVHLLLFFCWSTQIWITF
jgi:hypothetical protein